MIDIKRHPITITGHPRRAGAPGGRLDYMIRSASLTNYVGVARSVGLDPYEMLAAVGLDRSVLLDPDTRIPGEAVRELL